MIDDPSRKALSVILASLDAALREAERQGAERMRSAASATARARAECPRGNSECKCCDGNHIAAAIDALPLEEAANA